jgi:hypothetical protein
MPLLANKCICCLLDNLSKSQSVLSPFFLSNYLIIFIKIKENIFNN